MSWEVPEHDQHERGRNWYILAFLITGAMMLYAFLSANFLFAMIILIGAFILILREGHGPLMVRISLTTEGIRTGRKFYDYDDLKDFSIVYKPAQGFKNLYIEFKNPIKPRISVPLDSMDPLKIRENLLRYLPEDLDRTNPPTSEGLAKILKL